MGNGKRKLIPPDKLLETNDQPRREAARGHVRARRSPRKPGPAGAAGRAPLPLPQRPRGRAGPGRGAAPEAAGGDAARSLPRRARHKRRAPPPAPRRLAQRHGRPAGAGGAGPPGADLLQPRPEGGGRGGAAGARLGRGRLGPLRPALQPGPLPRGRHRRAPRPGALQLRGRGRPGLAGGPPERRHRGRAEEAGGRRPGHLPVPAAVVRRAGHPEGLVRARPHAGLRLLLRRPVRAGAFPGQEGPAVPDHRRGGLHVHPAGHQRGRQHPPLATAERHPALLRLPDLGAPDSLQHRTHPAGGALPDPGGVEEEAGDHLGGEAPHLCPKQQLQAGLSRRLCPEGGGGRTTAGPEIRDDGWPASGEAVPTGQPGQSPEGVTRPGEHGGGGGGLAAMCLLFLGSSAASSRVEAGTLSSGIAWMRALVKCH